MQEDKADKDYSLFPVGGELPQKSYRDLLVATDKQLRKDFHPHISFPLLPDDFSADDLRNVLRDTLDALIRDNPAALEQILYRIDLSESVRRQAMRSGLEALTEAVLRREALKVWIRSNYSEEL